MEKIIIIAVLFFTVNLLFAQKIWFKTYSDSIALMKDANQISD